MKIKIAVEVGFDDDGDPHWQAFAYSGEEDFYECMSNFEELKVVVSRYWVTAEVPDLVKASAAIPEIAAEAIEPVPA